MRIRYGICIGILAALAGCGQKGALYLPDADPTTVSKTDAADARPAADAPAADTATSDSTTEERKRKN